MKGVHSRPMDIAGTPEGHRLGSRETGRLSLSNTDRCRQEEG